MSWMTRLATGGGIRAATPSRPTPPVPRAASRGVYYTAPGMPQQPMWDGRTAIENGYLASVYVMQPVRAIATALGSLPFRVGANPDKPGDYDQQAPLARLLGPPPNGPNPVTSPRNLWVWSLVQRLITGRMAWETVTGPRSDVPLALWPIVAPFLEPIPDMVQSSPGQPVHGTNRWFSGYRYNLPTGYLDYTADQVFYSWRPSQMDWRQPESALQAASLPVSLQVAMDRYMWALAKNGMAAKKLVVTPEFAEDDQRRAFQDQFLAEFSGFDNGGKIAFGEYIDDGPPQPGQGARTPDIQVVDLATTPADADVIELLREVKNDLNITWRVPRSMIGDASERTYENADQEHRNFWTGPVMELAAEIADDVNVYLAPRFGDGLVGWFDFSGVEALKRGSIFAPIAPDAAAKAGLIKADDWRDDVGLPPLNPADALVTEELPSIEDTPGGASPSNFKRAPEQVKAAGLAVKALDTGRVLMLQRALVDDDPAAGCWEFPGGCLEDGEHPLAAAVREWQEETGASLPRGTVAGSWTSPNGIYRGYVYLVPAEADLSINLDHEDRHILNPDDPDGDQIEVLAWFDPTSLPGMPSLRPEARQSTDWDLLAMAGAERVELDTEIQTRSAAEWLQASSGVISSAASVASCIFARDTAMAARAGTCTGPGPCDTSSFGEGKNWVNKAGGLPPYIRAVAHAFRRKGLSESESIERAVGVVRNWAEGKGKVSAATRARAARAIAQWEALKAKAHTQRDALTEGGSAGALLPTGASPRLVKAAEAAQRHVFVPGAEDRRRCRVCGGRVTARVHTSTGTRHAGAGHHPVPSGHHPSVAKLRQRTHAQVENHAATLEPQLAEVMRGLFAKQERATVDRLTGRRGGQMLARAATPPPDDGTPPSAAPVDAGMVFDLAHWMAETRAALNPVYAAVTALSVARMQTELHPQQQVAPDNVFSLAQAAARRALEQRGSKLADVVTRTTANEISAALAEGLAKGEGVDGLAKRVRGVFAEASRSRAETIARTEVIGSLNTAADSYAAALPTGLVARREWLAAHDDRTRPDHREADGQRRDVGQPFTVGGFPMMHPGDIAAPPSLTVNCRCTTIYVPARVAKLEALPLPIANVA